MNLLKMALLSVIASILPPPLNAQDELPYDITFGVRGDATEVESVTVTNLTNPDIKPVTLTGSDVLRLGDDGGIPGDVNEDGEVNINDVVAIINVMAGTASWPNANVNADPQGGVDINDVVAVINIMAGKGAKQRKAPKTYAAGQKVVKMDYAVGDMLRFDGTSGKMRMLFHLSPESSHPVYFDFFRCEDADGYNYPIVRAGDMLWMMEDLRPLRISGVVKTDNKTIWKGIDELGAAEFVNGDRAYYTVAGARLALPKGWEMPSIDEIYAFIKELKADSLKLGDFLKDRGYEWPLELTEGLDTIHMNLRANGYVDRGGELVDDGLIGAWATRTTVNRGHPATFEINATTSSLYPLVKHGRGFGFSIRGCRPAPSVYQEMLQQAFKPETEASTAPRKMPMQLVNSNGPLGSYYTYGADRNSVFFDYTSQQWGGGVEQRSGMLYKPDESNYWIFTNKNLVKTDVNGADPERHLRKVTAQGNAADYENVVYASWSKPFRVFTDGTTKGKVAEVAAVMGLGVVNITIYGDSTKNNAIIDGYDGERRRGRLPFSRASGSRSVAGREPARS